MDRLEVSLAENVLPLPDPHRWSTRFGSASADQGLDKSKHKGQLDHTVLTMRVARFIHDPKARSTCASN